MSHSLLDQGVLGLATAFKNGEQSAESIASASLKRIEATSNTGAYLTVQSELALERAAELDRRRQQGEDCGPLAGVPIAIKDALCTQGVPTTSGSKILLRTSKIDEKDPNMGWRPPYDATCVARLKAAGAILVGKTNMDEFAMGSSNENSAFWPAKNPWNIEHAPGGSSGGSAAAVAAATVPGALGSDTGGSIRQPASFCGIVGVKPSYGAVSRYGLVAFASSLDQVGPMTSDVRGSAALLEVIAGQDPKDSTTVALTGTSYLAACERSVSKKRIGIPAEYFAEGLDPEIAAILEEAKRALVDAGCELVPVSLPHSEYGVATYYLLATAEASSNLARFEGIRFGMRIEKANADLMDLMAETRDAGFGPEVKRRIMLGTYALSAGYYDAYYKKAQQVRTLICRDFADAFTQVDALLTPVTPEVAFKLGEKSKQPLAMYLSDIYTLPASLAGVAGMSVPFGMAKSKESGASLPVGVQLLCPAFAEETMFALGSALEARSSVRGIWAP